MIPEAMLHTRSGQCYTAVCGKSVPDGQISVENEGLSSVGAQASVKCDSNVTFYVTFRALFYSYVTSRPKLLTLGFGFGMILA